MLSKIGAHPLLLTLWTETNTSYDQSINQSMNKYDDRRSHPSSSFGVVSLIHSRIWPSIHPSMLINPNLYTDPDPIASIHLSIDLSLDGRRRIHTWPSIHLSIHPC